MSATADRHRRLAAEFTRRVAAVPDDAWDAQSPCADWTVRGVVAHMVDNYALFPRFVDLTVTPRSNVQTDPAAAWAEVRDQLQDILADPARAGLEYDGMFGRTSLERSVDQILCFDLLVHGWDVARSTGQDETLPAAEVDLVYRAALGMGEMLRHPDVCGPEVPVPADAPRQDRMLGLLGRTP